MIVTLKALQRLGIDPASARVVIQGFGNVGGMAARLMRRRGFKIVCVIEYDGAVYNPNGLDVEAAHAAPARTPAPSPAFRAARTSTATKPCSSTAKSSSPPPRRTSSPPKTPIWLRCKVLCEGANGPTTALADGILEEKGIFVIPDILANAGGVTVSYFEWVQDRQGFFWNEQLVNERLQEIMEESFDAVVEYAEKPRRQQPHRRLHAGARPRGLRHQAAGDLRVAKAGVGS